jgi:hypothetical protein
MLVRATPAELARISRIRAEFRPWRLLAFELQRRGYAARGWVLPGSSASILHGRWPSCGVAEKRPPFSPAIGCSSGGAGDGRAGETCRRPSHHGATGGTARALRASDQLPCHPIGDEMFYRYQQSLIDEAAITLGALLQQSSRLTTAPPRVNPTIESHDMPPLATRRTFLAPAGGIGEAAGPPSFRVVRVDATPRVCRAACHEGRGG